MKKTSYKVLVINNMVVGYSEYKAIVKQFIKEHNIRDYHIEKIKEIPKEVEEEFSQKELYADYYYECITSEWLLYQISAMVNTMAENLLKFDESIRQCMDYMKLEPHEHDILLECHHHLYSICGDTIGIDGDSLEGYYSDYFDILKTINRFIGGDK